MNPYIRLPEVPIVHGRQGIVLERCVGKRVLHLGCVDSGLLSHRYQFGELMHQRLAEVAGDLWGVDLDSQGVATMRELGFPHVLVGDVCQLDSIQELKGQQFDVILASEIIEHLLNPGQFLASARRLMVPGVTELIVTVPNAFRLNTLRWLLKGIEYVHPDHVYWFSYHTITNLLRKTGFKVEGVFVYSFTHPGVHMPQDTSAPRTPAPSALRRAVTLLARLARNPLRYARVLPTRLLIHWLYRKTPFWGDGLVVIATAAKDEDA